MVIFWFLKSYLALPKVLYELMLVTCFLFVILCKTSHATSEIQHIKIRAARPTLHSKTCWVIWPHGKNHNQTKLKLSISSALLGDTQRQLFLCRGHILSPTAKAASSQPVQCSRNPDCWFQTLLFTAGRSCHLFNTGVGLDVATRFHR